MKVIFHKPMESKYLKMHVVKVIFLSINCSLLLQMYVLRCRLHLNVEISFCRQCQWPRGNRHVSAGVGLLGLWFESRREYVCLSVDNVVLLGRVLYDELITRPGKSQRRWCVLSVVEKPR